MSLFLISLKKNRKAEKRSFTSTHHVIYTPTGLCLWCTLPSLTRQLLHWCPYSLSQLLTDIISGNLPFSPCINSFPISTPPFPLIYKYANIFPLILFFPQFPRYQLFTFLFWSKTSLHFSIFNLKFLSSHIL